jgi:DNA uptake protein ComE-like DNA-binding protein
MHMANPQKKSEPKVDQEVAESFPASDPPSYMGSTAVAGAPRESAHAETQSGRPIEKEAVRIDINSATEEELGSLTALGPDHVRSLLERRPFDSWEDLKELPDFDGETIAALRKGGAHIND